MYDGQKLTARAWLYQLQTYFTLSPNLVEEDAIHFASLHFEGDALEWWRHGVISQNYFNITFFDEFARRLVKRFDRKKEDDYFQDLTSLRQLGVVDEYVVEFQRIVVMIHNISKERLTFMFVEGLMDPLQGMVRVSAPTKPDNAIRVAYDLEPTVKSLKGGKTLRAIVVRKGLPNKEGPSKAKPFP